MLRALAAETAQRTDAAPGSAELDVRLDAPLPESLAVGAGTALFVCGTCFAPGAPVAALTLLVDGEEQPLMAHGMPRLDLLRATGEPASYRAGFWGFARIGPRAAGGASMLAVRATLRGGGELGAELARVAVAEPLEPLPGAPLVAICMAAFEPPLELFRRQVESIRAQTLTDWICVVSDDCSDPERFAEMRDGAGRRSAVRPLALGPAARLLPQLRARAGAGAGRTPATSRWPIRTTSGTPTSSRRWCARSATRSSSTATSGSSRRTAS